MKIVLLYLVFNVFFYFAKPVLHAKIENKIILKVENEIITNYEIKNKILTTLILTDQQINQNNIDKLKKQALEFLIQNKLRKIELAKHSFKKDDAEIRSYLQSISKNDIESLKNRFKKNNISFELFLEEIEIQLKWQKFIFKKFSDKIQIDENTIDQEIKSIVKGQTEVVEFKISEIEIFLNNDINENQKISNILTKIKNDGFGETALKLSISTTASKKGDLGWINSKSLSKDIYKAIGNLPHKFIGYTNSFDNINSIIIDISSSKTFPDTYNITNSITHKYTFTDSVTTETYTPLDIYPKTNDSLNVNEYYINNSTTPYNVLDGTLNRGIIRSHIKNIKICGNNSSNNTIFDNYILITKQIISSNIIRIGLKNNEQIPILYKNYYQINKVILINNEKINIIKTIQYNDLYYEISLYYEDNFNININIIPYHSISFVYSNTKKNQNKINIYKYNFNLNDLYNKCITISIKSV